MSELPWVCACCGTRGITDGKSSRVTKSTPPLPDGEAVAGWIVHFEDGGKCFYFEHGVAIWKSDEFDDRGRKTSSIVPVVYATRNREAVAWLLVRKDGSTEATSNRAMKEHWEREVIPRYGVPAHIVALGPLYASPPPVSGDVRAATIEECAQVADRLKAFDHRAEKDYGAAIRALSPSGEK